MDKDRVALIFDSKKGCFDVNDPEFVSFVGSSLEDAKKICTELIPLLKSKAARAKKVPWIIEHCPICACCCCCCFLGSIAGQFGDELTVEINATKIINLHKERLNKNKIDVEFSRRQDGAEQTSTVDNILVFKVYVEPPPPEKPENINIKNPNEEMNQLNEQNKI